MVNRPELSSFFTLSKRTSSKSSSIFSWKRSGRLFGYFRASMNCSSIFRMHWKKSMRVLHGASSFWTRSISLLRLLTLNPTNLSGIAHMHVRYCTSSR